MIVKRYVVLAFCLISLGNRLHAETLTVGVPEIPKDIRVLDSKDVYADLARSAVMSGLTKLSETSARLSFQLDEADNLQVSPDYKTWSFHIRKSARFNNGEALGVHDVLYSLQRCVSHKILPAGLTAKGREGLEEETVAGWIDMDVFTILPSATPEGLARFAREFPAQLSHCPLLAEQVARDFEKDFGLGTNFVAAGRFEIVSFQRGKALSLRSSQRYFDEREGGRMIEIRAFGSETHALTALQVGTVDVFFAKDAMVISQAERDATLQTAQCREWTMISRQGLDFPCEPRLDVTKMKYRS